MMMAVVNIMVMHLRGLCQQYVKLCLGSWQWLLLCFLASCLEISFDPMHGVAHQTLLVLMAIPQGRWCQCVPTVAQMTDEQGQLGLPCKVIHSCPGAKSANEQTTD